MRDNRLITLGVLLLAFSALADAEWNCTVVEDCIHGESCRIRNDVGTCACSTYWDKPAGTKGPCNVSTAPKCEDDSCVYGNCSVVDHKIECECEDGASGDHCQLLDVDNCKINGNEDRCKNGAQCTNLLNDYKCTCLADSHWAGITCEEYSFFSVMADQQVVFDEDFTKLSVMVLTKEPNWHSLLLMFYIDDGNGAKKVTLTAAPGTAETLITLNIDATIETYKWQNAIDWDAYRKIEASIDESHNLVIKLDDIITHTVLQAAGTKGTKVVFGGCDWLNQGSMRCSALFSRDDVYYEQFEGGVQGLALNDIAKGYTAGLGGHKDMFTCSNLTCVGPGSSGCTASTIPHCACNEGYAGPQCSQYDQASFNGYTSKVSVLKHPYLGGRRVGTKEVIIAFSVNKKFGRDFDQECLAVITGQLTTATDFVTKVLLKENGMLYAEDKAGQVTACSKQADNTDDRIMVHVMLNGVYYYCPGHLTPAYMATDLDHTELSVVLGYDEGPAAGKANLQGCITDLSIDGQSVYFRDGDSVEADYTRCVNDFLPADPCIEQTCTDRGTCDINKADYSARCTCEAGFNGTSCESVYKCALIANLCGPAEAGTCVDKNEAPYFECKCGERYQLDAASKICVINKCYECNQAIAEEKATECNINETTSAADCTCTEGWKGETCSAEASVDPVKQNTQTILIIVVVSLLVLMVVLVAAIFTVRRCNRKSQGEGTYSPNKAELEMGATTKGDNIYKNSEVIENVNAESKLFETSEVNFDTSYNIYNISRPENGVVKDEAVHDIVPDPSHDVTPPPLDPPPPAPTEPPPSGSVQEEIVLPPPPPMEDAPIIYETIEPPPPANDLPEPPTPLNTTAAESTNVTMDTSINNADVNMDTKVDDVKVDIEDCQDSNRLSTI